MKRFIKISIAVLSVVAGAAVMLIGFSHWVQKQLSEVFSNIDWDGFEEGKSGIIPEVVEQKN